METLRDPDARPTNGRPTVVTIGMFDGVHRGHAVLFEKVVADARALDAAAAIVTFDPHPAEVVAPERAPCVLTTVDQRLALFEERGIDITVVLQFDKELSNHTPAEFVKAALVDVLHVKKVIVGEDFRFGHNRAGDVATLTELGGELGFEAEAIGLVGGPDGKVGSSEIRRLIADGEVERAADLLGHSYKLAGEVVHGDHRGRQLGFPTANMSPHPRACLPRLGVYAGWWVWAGKRLPGVINVGVRPTFKDSDPPLTEIHVLDFEGDLYGQHGEVEFTAFLRPEEKFDGIDALVAQIRDDADRAREVLTG